MNRFLEMLGERKYLYHHSLHIAKPQAYSRMECSQRLEAILKQEELLNVIDHLPREQQKIVEEKFNELKI